MPEWVTHLTAGWIVGKAVRADRKTMTFLLLGSLLPDLGYKWYMVLTNIMQPHKAFLFLMPLHALLGGLLLSVFVAGFFPEKWFSTATKYLAIGVLTHLFLDSFLTHFGTSMTYFIPLSQKPMGIPILWSDNPLPLFFSLFLIATIHIRERLSSKVPTNRGENR
ncbi:MAG: metal-dependent hydrolase [Candidatus Altiarchaeota archaeon]